jgi:hypothetical protein
MNPFYKLNKTLDGIRNEPTQEQKALVESRAPKSPAKQTLEQALRTDLRSLMEDGSAGLAGGQRINKLSRNTVKRYVDKVNQQTADRMNKADELGYDLHDYEHTPKDMQRFKHVKKAQKRLDHEYTPENDMHDKKPMDTNPKNTQWDDQALSQHKRRVAAEKNRLVMAMKMKNNNPNKKLAESDTEILDYLRSKLGVSDNNKKYTAMSHRYNGPAGAADAYNGMEFEETANGPHGKPGWLIDAQKRAEHRAGYQVDENGVLDTVTGSDDYDDEGRTFKNSLHTIARIAKDLDQRMTVNEEIPEWISEKIGAVKGMLSSIMQYIVSDAEMQHDPDAEPNMDIVSTVPMSNQFPGKNVGLEFDEESSSQAQAHMMAGAAHNRKFAKKVGVKQSVAKEFNQADKGKDISKLPKKVKKTEEATPTRDNRAERAGKKVTKDIEYDEKKKDGIHSKSRRTEDDKAERAGKRVATDIEYDEKKSKPADKKAKNKPTDKKAENKPTDTKKSPAKNQMKKEEKVEETTTSGSVSPSAGEKSSGSSGVGKGIYDSWNHKYENLLKENISITTNATRDDTGKDVEDITININGDDVSLIKQLLQNMGVSQGENHEHTHGGEEPCDTCGGIPCQCDEVDIGGALDGGPVGAAIGGRVGGSMEESDITEPHDEDDDPYDYEGGEDTYMRDPLFMPHPHDLITDPDHPYFKKDMYETDDDMISHQRMMELAGLDEASITITNNQPDYPSNQEYSHDEMQYSGGLNGKKSTGQTTIPVVASQVNRMDSQVSEGQRMNDLYKAIQAIENKEV